MNKGEILSTIGFILCIIVLISFMFWYGARTVRAVYKHYTGKDIVEKVETAGWIYYKGNNVIAIAVADPRNNKVLEIPPISR